MGSRDMIRRLAARIARSALALALCLAPACDDGGEPAGGGAGDTADVANGLDVVPEIVPSVPTPAELAAVVDQALWWEDLQFIAQPREPGSAHWQAVQDLCAERFEDLGYTVTRHEYDTGVNVIGVKEGLTTPDEWVVVSGHYDHHPGCPGADDNGAAVAGLLEIARAFAPVDFDRTVVLACWDEEEIGLKGSGAWAFQQAEAGREIVSSLVLETMAYTCDEPGCQKMPMGFDLMFPEEAAEFSAGDESGDFIVLIADSASTDSAEAMVEHAAEIDLPIMHIEMSEELMGSPVLMDLFRSDHASFWFNDYPAIMITDSANFRNPNYHCPDADHMDTADTLDGAFATKVTKATAYSAASLAGVR
jgi:hypothetical protein